MCTCARTYSMWCYSRPTHLPHILPHMMFLTRLSPIYVIRVRNVTLRGKPENKAVIIYGNGRECDENLFFNVQETEGG